MTPVFSSENQDAPSTRPFAPWAARATVRLGLVPQLARGVWDPPGLCRVKTSKGGLCRTAGKPRGDDTQEVTEDL